MVYGGQSALAEKLGYSVGAVNRWRGSKGISDTENPLSLSKETREIMAAFKGWTPLEWIGYIEGYTEKPIKRQLHDTIGNLSLKELVEVLKILNDRLDKLVNAQPIYGIHSQLNDRQLFNLRKLLKASLDKDGFLRADGMDYVAAAAKAEKTGHRLVAILRELLEGSSNPGILQPLVKRGVTSLCYVVAEWDNGVPALRKNRYTDWGKMLRDLDYREIGSKAPAS